MDKKRKKVEYPFLQGGGEMGELIRNFPWETTSLGNPVRWPSVLRVSLSVLLRSKFPMIIFWGSDFVCFYNDALRPSLGTGGKHPAVLGQKAELGFPEIWPAFRGLMTAIMDGGEASFNQHQLLPIYRNGQMEDVYWTFGFSPIPDEEGTPAGILVITNETTDVLKATRETEESERRFRSLIEESPIAKFLFTGPDFVIEVANESVLKSWARDATVIGKPVVQAFPELDGHAFIRKLDHVFSTGEPVSAKELEVKIVVNRSAEISYYDFTFTPIRNSTGDLYGILTTGVDVTENVRSRKKIEESESHFRTMVQQAPVAMGLTSGPEMIFDTVNPPMLRLMNKDVDIIGKPLLKVLPELDGHDVLTIMRRVYHTGKPYQGFEIPISLKSWGSPEQRFFNISYTPFFKNGAVSGILEVATDVTFQVIANKKITEAEEKARLAIESADLGSYEVNLSSNEINASPRFQAIWELGDSNTRNDFVSAIHPDDRAIRTEAMRTALKSGNLNYEVRIKLPKGGERWVKVRGKVFYNLDKEPSRLVGVAQDVTDQKLFTEELERQVRQRTAEMENKNQQLKEINQELEQFTYAASHDMQEPLRKVQTFTSFLLNDHHDGLSGDVKNYISQIGVSVKRMKTIINDLLNYSQQTRQGQHFTATDLNQVVHSVLMDMTEVRKEKQPLIEIDPLPVIVCVPEQIMQLFANLFANSLKFSQDGRRVKIAVLAEMLSGEKAALIKPLDPGKSYVKLSFADNGIGFDGKYAEQIFDLFKRLHSKSRYEGSGIGLGLCKKIVQNHNGAIWAESTLGDGATFHVLLPVGM